MADKDFGGKQEEKHVGERTQPRVEPFKVKCYDAGIPNVPI